MKEDTVYPPERVYLQYYSLIVREEPGILVDSLIDRRLKKYISKMAELVGVDNIPLLHFKGTGVAITSSKELRDLERILAPLGGRIAGYKVEAETKRAYFEVEHQKNLKEICQLEEGKATETPAQITLSVADIISDPRIQRSKSWFSRTRKKLNLPSGDTMKDHGEAWTDGEKKIIKPLVEYLEGVRQRRYNKLHPRNHPKETYPHKKRSRS